MTLIFTICSNNYLAQAITLGKSLIDNNPDYEFRIGLVDKMNPEIDYTSIPYKVIEVENIKIDEFHEMFARYSITELNTAVKPFYFKFFFEKDNNIDRFIYLDPDIYVYKSFSELESVLSRYEIVITPHFTTPINDGKFQGENDFLNSGLYNLGFIALRRGVEALKLIEWWSERMQTMAYIDFAKGMFTDQIWLNFAPLFFKNVHVFNNPGYNMAYWNLHERFLDETNNILKDEYHYPLVFFHFSGFSPRMPSVLSKYQDRYSFTNRTDISHLFSDYSERLIGNRFDFYYQVPCYYAEEKQKLDLKKYVDLKNSIPLYKRVLRGIILRLISCLNINIRYYTN